jgi:hypothetical protein
MEVQFHPALTLNTRRAAMASKAKRKSTARARRAHPKLDPAFTSIGRKKATMAAFLKEVDAEAALEKEGVKAGSPRARAAAAKWHIACIADDRATRALVRTIPRTLGGLAALAEYAAEIYVNEIHPARLAAGATLLRSIAEAAIRLRVAQQ